MKRLAVLITILAPLAVPAEAQQPRVANGRVETRASAALSRDFNSTVNSAAGPTWIGYAVPKEPGFGNSCCNSGAGRGCGLEGETNFANSASRSGPVQLEGDSFAAILFRIDQRNVRKVRSFSLDCDLDAGGLPFIWLSGVKPAESLALLESLAKSTQPGTERELKYDSLIAAIAAHADPGADKLLEGFVAADQPLEVRQKAAFWLGAARGRRGYEILNRLVREDRDEKLRDKAVFALSISKEPEALDSMIRVAKEDSNAHVRGQALFWLGQKAGRKAAGAISATISDDPETEVKRRAVFALSQLPKDQGIPLLIDVAKNNRNPAVRKQAFFWLGQSRDPRALEYIEAVLTK